MEELTAALEESSQVSSAHPRLSQYKSKSSPMCQESRRSQVLKYQKQCRFDAANLVRCLTEDVWDDEDDDDDYNDDDDDAAVDEMDVEYVKINRPGRNYRDQLMLSEWMFEVPDSFVKDWTMIVCPAGKRNLIIASKGKTRSYSRSGWLVNSFQSCLPGGARSMSHWRTDTTILDCVYSEVDQCYYVLDMMCWKQQPIYDSEAEFRFYWLKTKFAEIPEVALKSSLNPYPFHILPNYDCTNDSITTAMSSDFKFELDGLLFYHKHAAYTFGTTPLVVWLKAYMMPEILSVSVPHKLLSTAPASYVDFSTHVLKVKSDASEKQKNCQEKNADNVCMDTVEKSVVNNCEEMCKKS